MPDSEPWLLVQPDLTSPYPGAIQVVVTLVMSCLMFNDPLIVRTCSEVQTLRPLGLAGVREQISRDRYRGYSLRRKLTGNENRDASQRVGIVANTLL